ncbi:hypothetical protein [Streptomyces platensis]|uniref:hypothetical protein n=1 Tax=Streptomyces platensis TaxID=58346 RepID=UPI00117E9A86|nr:hypothetical protein [Streptomyces platensis]
MSPDRDRGAAVQGVGVKEEAAATDVVKDRLGLGEGLPELGEGAFTAWSVGGRFGDGAVARRVIVCAGCSAWGGAALVGPGDIGMWMILERTVSLLFVLAPGAHFRR